MSGWVGERNDGEMGILWSGGLLNDDTEPDLHFLIGAVDPKRWSDYLDVS